MAQRKSSPPNRSGASKSGAARTKAPAGRGGSGATRPPGGPARKPPGKGKSIVNQKQTPWGLIAATTAVVLFAAAIVIVVIATRKSDTKAGGDGTTTVSKGGQTVDTKDSYRQPALAAAMAIKGVTYKVEGEHDHVGGIVKYDSTPPVGGDHSPLWADCNGNVYTHQLANENAVHALEHGAVWVTYNPKDLTKAQIATLAKDVDGVDRTLMTPYAGLSSPISLQAWGYQLFLSSPTDSRIKTFIKTLAGNPKTWPEQGATCTDPYWDAAKSTPGHPLEQA